jgi:hypothetical protein
MKRVGRRVGRYPVKEYCDPAASVFAKFGEGDIANGITFVSKHLNWPRRTIHDWLITKDRKGTDGHIPRWRHHDLIELGRQHNVAIDVSDFYR